VSDEKQPAPAAGTGETPGGAPVTWDAACVNTAHCKARRKWGDGECGCYHDSIGIVLSGGLQQGGGGGQQR
jgi:hypothetical protein